MKKVRVRYLSPERAAEIVELGASVGARHFSQETLGGKPGVRPLKRTPEEFRQVLRGYVERDFGRLTKNYSEKDLQFSIENTGDVVQLHFYAGQDDLGERSYNIPEWARMSVERAKGIICERLNGLGARAYRDNEEG